MCDAHKAYNKKSSKKDHLRSATHARLVLALDVGRPHARVLLCACRPPPPPRRAVAFSSQHFKGAQYDQVDCELACVARLSSLVLFRRPPRFLATSTVFLPAANCARVRSLTRARRAAAVCASTAVGCSI